MNITDTNIENGELLDAVKEILLSKKKVSPAISDRLHLALSLRALERVNALTDMMAKNIVESDAIHAGFKDKIDVLERLNILMWANSNRKIFTFLCAGGLMLIWFGRPVIVWALSLAGVHIPQEWFG